MQLYFQALSTVIPKSGERPILTPDRWPGFSIGLSNCRPTSRGSIMIRSNNPLDHPKIVPNAFSTEADVAEMLDGGEIPAQDRLHAVHGGNHRGGGLAWTICTTDDELIADFRQPQWHCLSSGFDLPHGPGPGDMPLSIRG